MAEGIPVGMAEGGEESMEEMEVLRAESGEGEEAEVGEERWTEEERSVAF